MRKDKKDSPTDGNSANISTIYHKDMIQSSRRLGFNQMEGVMTNWCRNSLVVTGDDVHVSQFKKQAVGYWPGEQPEPGLAPGDLNFHSIVPMPDAVIKAGYQSAGKEWQLRN
jgi:hypothetical protein